MINLPRPFIDYPPPRGTHVKCKVWILFLKKKIVFLPVKKKKEKEKI